MPVTHQQIATKLGVSRVLVTSALHGTRGAGIAAETQELVLRTARDMGYVPRTRTTHTVGLVIQGEVLGNEAEGAIMREVEAALQQRGFRLALAAVWEGNVAPLREVLTPKNVDGLIITESFGGRIADLALSDLPHVLTFDEGEVGVNSDLVTVDTVGTLEAATRHLLERGHRRICLLSLMENEKRVDGVYQHMEDGVRKAFDKAGVSQDTLCVLEMSFDRGNVAPHAFGAQLVDYACRKQACTAIIAADLTRALPGFQALSASGLRVPQDISFLSVVDSYYFPAMHPPVTATTFYGSAVARRAVERLLEKIDDPDTPARHERIVGRVIERGSVGNV